MGVTGGWWRSARAILLSAGVGVVGCSGGDTPTAPSVGALEARAGRLLTYQHQLLPADFVPAALNEHLQVLGTSGLPFSQPARWTPAGGVSILPVPAGWNTVSPRSLNDDGVAAGVAAVNGVFHAVRWSPSNAPAALGEAYYIPGSVVNERGDQVWIQVLGPFSSPTGFDVRLLSRGTTRSLGVLPYDPGEASDPFGPLRLTDNGLALWGYGRWVFGHGRTWRQYDFPGDVISNSSLLDVTKRGSVIGTGFRLSLGRYGGYLWDQRGVRREVPPGFLPQRLLDDGTMFGYVLGPSGASAGAQTPAIRDPHGTITPLPVPAPPPGYALYYGWILDVTARGQAVGLVTYINPGDESSPVVGGPILWIPSQKLQLDANVIAMASTATVHPLSPAVTTALCRHPVAASSPLCRGSRTTLPIAGRL